MKRVFVKGDCHGEFSEVLDFINRIELTEEDYIIVLGDMGLFWRKDHIDADEFIQMYEADYKCNLWFVDGNHENFDLLDKVPIDENGFGIISEHIKYLPRGLTFELCGKRFLCMGGADSIDKFRRRKHLTWWEQEQISEEDIAKVDKTLHYDFVLSHTAPKSKVETNKYQLYTFELDEEAIDRTSEQRLEDMMDGLDFDNWRFGHFHSNTILDDPKFRCLYHNFEEII